MTFDERVREAAEFRAKCQCSTAQPDLDKAIQFYLRVGFQDGARFVYGTAKLETMRENSR